MNLYEIDQKLIELLSQADEDTGEISEDVFEQIINLNLSTEQKIENIALLIKNNLAEEAALKAEKIKLEQRQRVKGNSAERWKNYLSDYMNNSGRTKYESTRAVVSFRKSTACETDDTQVPEIYRIPQPSKVDKKAITEALKAGKDVPGAQLVEHQHIQVR